MKRQTTRIVEINIHRSKKNRKLGHAVAVLFPCSHHRYLGATLYRGPEDSNTYRANDARVIRFDDYSVMDKDTCKLCPYESDFYFENLSSDITLDDLVTVLETMDDDI